MEEAYRKCIDCKVSWWGEPHCWSCGNFVVSKAKPLIAASMKRNEEEEEVN